MKFLENIDNYDTLHERLNWLQNQIEELQSKVDLQESSSNVSHHRILSDKTWRSKRRHKFVDAREIKPAAIILTRSILQFLAPGPVSEKDLRISTANRCKDLGVKITGKGGVAGQFPPQLSFTHSNSEVGESMDVFTVCNVLQAIGVLEDAAINPPSTATSKEPNTPASTEPIDPTSPQQSITSSKLLHPDPSRSLSTIPLSTLSTPAPSTSILSESPGRISSGPPDLSQILRSSTPIIPISFEVGECSTPVNTSSNSNLSNLEPPVRNNPEVKFESEIPSTILSSTGPTHIPTSSIQPPQPRSTYGSQVESSLTARWEKQLRDYLKDLRCRKISHIMGRESYSSGLNSRVGSSNRSINPGPAARSSVPSSTQPVPLVNQSPNPVTQSSSLDEEDFEEDDETTNHSQSTTPPSTPIGIAVPPAPSTGLSIVLPQTSSQSRQTTTPRESSTLSVPKISLPIAAPIQTGMLSPTSSASTGNTAPVAKEKKPVMRRFTGSTRGGWTFPTPVSAPNDFGISQYDIFLNPQEVLTKWSQICYEENKAEEIEEILLRQIASKCGLSLPVEPFRIGTQYLSPDYRVSLTKTRSGSISQIPGELLSGSRPRSRSSSISGGRDGHKNASKQHHSSSSHAETATSTTSSYLLQNQAVDMSSPSVGDIKKSLPIVGGVYDESSSWTAAGLIEKAKRNQLSNRGKIFQKKPRFDDPSSGYFFSESHSSLLTSPRYHSTPLSSHGSQTPVDPPSSRKRSRSGSSVSTFATSTPGSNRPYCPTLLLYESLYRESDSTNTDQSAGPDVCPVTGRLSLVDIIINTRPIPWIDIAKQFNILQIDEDIDFVPQTNEDLASSKTQLFPIGHNLNGSIGTWVDIRVDSDGEKDAHAVVDLKTDESKAKDRRGRKKLSSTSEDTIEERRPKRLQRHSSISSLNGTNEDDRKNYRQEFRRVSFADVVAPSFRVVKNYESIYLSPNTEEDSVEESADIEDLSDEAIAKRHEYTLKRMRDKWAQIQELKDSLKRSTTTSTPSSDKTHPSPRHYSGSHKSSKSPGTPHEKMGRKSGSYPSSHSKNQRNSSIGVFDSGVVDAEVTPKRRRGRQNLQRSASESTAVGTTGRNRRNRPASPAEISSSVEVKKRNIKDVASESKSSDSSRPRKRGRPPKYHPPQASSASQPTIPSRNTLKAEKSLKKVESGLLTRLSSPSSSSRYSVSAALGQFPSSDVDTMMSGSEQSPEASSSNQHCSPRVQIIGSDNGIPAVSLVSPPDVKRALDYSEKPLVLVEGAGTVEFSDEEGDEKDNSPSNDDEDEQEQEEDEDEDEGHQDGDEEEDDGEYEDDNESEDF